MMVAWDPERRPSIHEVLRNLSLCDSMMAYSKGFIFNECCRISYVTKSLHTKELHAKTSEVRAAQLLLQESDIRAAQSMRLERETSGALEQIQTERDDYAVSGA